MRKSTFGLKNIQKTKTPEAEKNGESTFDPLKNARGDLFRAAENRGGRQNASDNFNV
jgi:hypothetical protein